MILHELYDYVNLSIIFCIFRSLPGRRAVVEEEDPLIILTTLMRVKQVACAQRNLLTMVGADLRM